MPVVLVEKQSPHVSLVTLNRPERRNALTVELMKELISAVESLSADAKQRVLILRGAGVARGDRVPRAERRWTVRGHRRSSGRGRRGGDRLARGRFPGQQPAQGFDDRGEGLILRELPYPGRHRVGRWLALALLGLFGLESEPSLARLALIVRAGADSEVTVQLRHVFADAYLLFLVGTRQLALGVRLRRERVALREQGLAELAVVLDDPVQDDRKLVLDLYGLRSIEQVLQRKIEQHPSRRVYRLSPTCRHRPSSAHRSTTARSPRR